MTTAPSSDPFTKDLDKLKTDADFFHKIQESLNDDIRAYHEQWEKIMHMSSENPDLIFAALMSLLGNQGSQQLKDNMAVDGAQMQVQSDTTKVANDLQNTTNNSTDKTTGADGLVAQVALSLDKVLDALGDPNSYISQALGTTASSTLHEQFLGLRHLINYKEDPEGDKYNPKAGETYYFDPDDSSKIQSFEEMQDDMKKQGDPKEANTAYKAKTDPFNMITSLTQSSNAASNEKVSYISNQANGINAFLVDMQHAWAKLIDAAVQATTRTG